MVIENHSSDESQSSSDEELKIEDEFVEEDEMENDDCEKFSVRPAQLKNERRFSRVILGSEKSLSKGKGFKIKWGVNIT